MATQQKREILSIKDLLEAGAHFGHQTRRWNPKMKKYIFEARNGLHIIDLAKTLQQIREGVEIVTEMVVNHKPILFVGTKKQAKAVVKELAEDCGEYYITERWLGGTMTNFDTMRQSIKKLDKIEKKIATGGEGLTKKELSLLTKEQIKLEKNLSGIRSLRKLPGLLIIVDPSKEHIAVAEARKLGIPIMGLVDTNCDPDPIQHVIACNDDALKSIKLILQTLSQAIIDKKNELKVYASKDEALSAKEEDEESEDETDEEILEEAKNKFKGEE